MEEDYRFQSNYDENKFASHGSGLGFEWFAYLNFYDSTIHQPSPEVQKEHDRSNHMNGFRKQYLQALNNNVQFRKRVKHPFVVATGQFAPGGYPLNCFVDALREFFRTDVILRNTPNNTPIAQLYKGKDLILPLIYADYEALDFLNFKAEQYAKMGCRSVTALFIYRVKPGVSDKYPSLRSYPRFSEYDFAGEICMDSNLDFLGALVKGMEESRNGNVYAGGL